MKIHQRFFTRLSSTRCNMFLFGVIFLGIFSKSCAPVNKTEQQGWQKQLLLRESFNGKLDSNRWKVELFPMPHSSVSVNKGKLVIDTRGGVTVWLKVKLSRDLLIEFDRKVLMDSAVNDRLSDLNMFWMAKDPKQENLFTRDGKFESYDSLSMYYVGMGGNYNTTTRFRKYMGTGEKRIIGENNDAAALLKPNHRYRIRISVREGLVSYEVDGKTLFSFQDPDCLTEGYFGFRSVWSRQEIDKLKVYKWIKK